MDAVLRDLSAATPRVARPTLQRPRAFGLALPKSFCAAACNDDQRDDTEGTMVKKMDKTLTRRANLAVVGGLVLLPLLRAMPAAGQPSEQDMLNALTRRRVRAPGATDPAPV